MKRLLYALVLPLFLFAGQVCGQERTVTGRVTDSAGTGIANASVVVKGAGTGTQTASDGGFTLRNIPASATTLTVTSVGYAPQDVPLGTGNVVITLSAASASLSEVVVVGYGTQRKRDVTGAIATVTEKEFQKGNITSPEQMIAGKVAGVQITSNGGAPGAGSRIRIRGGASLNASNDPLIVIDGVPVESGGVQGSANPLNLINPNDIESFTILKDPSAAAIYGSRASNGVVLITTKKGRRGKVVFNASAQFIAQTPARKVSVLSADQIRDIVNTKGASGDANKLGSASTDWQDEIFKTSYGQDINLSASGAAVNGKLPFRISGGFLNQDGILRTSNFQRQSLGLNLSPRFLKDQLRVNVNLKGARTTNRFADEGAIGSAISFDPTQPVRTSSNRFGGFFEYLETISVGVVPKDLSPRNPVALLEMRDSRSEVLRSLGNIQFDYSLPFLRDLRANLNLGYDIQSGNGTVVASDSAGAYYRRYEIGKNAAGNDIIVNYGGLNNEYKSKQQNLLLDFYLNYVKNIASISSRIDVMAGYGYQDFKYTNYNFPDRRFNKTIIAGTQPAFAMEQPQYTLLSYYARLNYTLANKYVLTLNGRADGTSKFSKNNRWGFFPSAAFAWRLKDEAFLKTSKTISDLKLRVGYGVTGQQAGISFFGYIPRYERSNNSALYQIGNTFDTMYRPSAYDPFLKWETTSNINAAIDYGFFDNRINGSIDVFYRKTKDLLSLVPIPLGTNFTNQQVRNVGNIESRGFELSLNAIPVQRQGLSWDFGFNFTYINPKITNLLLNPDPSFRGNQVGGISGGTGNTIQIQSVGYNPSTFFVYQQVYDNAGKPIEGLYEDKNRDGIINAEDLYRYKSSEPRFLLGFTNNVNFKEWSIGFVLRGTFDNYNYNNVYSNLGVRRAIFNPLGYINNGSTNYLETNFENNQYFSDYYIQNASFLRMDNINIGYNAGQIFKNARLRISANIQNAFVITKYKGIDPEIPNGIDNQFYPRPRTYVVGLNLDF